MAGPLAAVLVHDPDLAGTLRGERLRRAERDLVAATTVAFEGAWDPLAPGEDVRGGIGLLVLEGLVVRRVGRDGRYGAELLGPYPEVAGALVGRAMQRSRALAVTMAIAHYPRIDRRLLMFMWHLADRWGRVTPEGIRIPLRLTHQLLADLVAARRPSVTSALSQLAHEGHIARMGDAWVLQGEPPGELSELHRAGREG